MNVDAYFPTASAVDAVETSYSKSVCQVLKRGSYSTTNGCDASNSSVWLITSHDAAARAHAAYSNSARTRVCLLAQSFYMRLARTDRSLCVHEKRRHYEFASHFAIDILRHRTYLKQRSVFQLEFDESFLDYFL